MSKCFWCHKDKELYAYNLCLSCYRWFRRRIDNPVEYCDLCGAIVTKNQKGICKKCKDLLDKTTKVPKRVQNIKNKFSDIKDTLERFTEPLEAHTYLEDLFKPKEKKFLDVLIDRYYRHMTLDEIGQRYSNTREYIRQCEDRAIEIIKKQTGIEGLFEDEKEEDLFSNKW